MNKEIYGSICVVSGMVAGALLYRAKTIKYVKKVNRKLTEGTKEVESASKIVAESGKRMYKIASENLDLKRENERLKMEIYNYEHDKEYRNAVTRSCYDDPCEEFRNLVARSCI